MKKLVLSLISALICTSVINAQKGKPWLEFGLKGGGGISVITNKNMWDDKKSVAPTMSGCYSFGAKLAFNLSENHQIAFEYNMGMRSMKYDFLVDSVKSNVAFKLNVSDLMLMYRYNGNNGGYFEVGGCYTTISKASEKRSDGADQDIKKYFTNYTSAMLGFGGNMVQSGSFTWTMGVRFGYSFTDALSTEGGAGSSRYYPLNSTTYYKEYSTYKMTKPITAQIITEFNFDLGYLAKSNCKRGRVSFMSF